MYGLMAEYESAEKLLRAARASYAAGYRQIDAYSPFPVEGLAEAVGMRSNRVAYVTFMGGLIGAVGAYIMQWYATVISYPVNIGGRPHHSWPAFIPITFEVTVLCAGLSAALIGVIIMNGLPRPYHPVFNAPRFARASVDGFFLCVEASDPCFSRIRTEQFLSEAGASAVFEVEE